MRNSLDTLDIVKRLRHGLGGICHNLDHKIEVAGDVVVFRNMSVLLHSGNKMIVEFWMFQTDQNIGGDILVNFFGIQNNGILLDNAVSFHFFDTLNDGGDRHFNLGADH